MLVPDEVQREVHENHNKRQSQERGKNLFFAYGYNIRYVFIAPPDACMRGEIISKDLRQKLMPVLQSENKFTLEIMTY